MTSFIIMNPTLESFLIGPTLFLAFLIYANFNKANKTANRGLAAFILCVFLIQIGSPIEKSNFFPAKSIVFEILNLASFIVAPTFYLTISYFVAPSRKWKFTDNLHFLFPFLILILTILTLFVDTSAPKTIEEKKLESKIVLIFSVFFCTMVTVYCVAAYRKIHKYQKDSYSYSSNTKAVDLKWLQQVTICVLLLTFVWLIDIFFQLSVTSLFFDTFSNLFTFIGILYIAFHALKQKEIFPFNTAEKLEIDTIIEATSQLEENRRKLITDEKLNELKAYLIQIMEEQKPFLDCELSVIKLASQVKITPHLLSYIINAGFNENFYQFINKYRINEAKKMIINPEMNHLNLLGIGYEVGFNSKTVFNTTFKKITNLTPTEFKKSIQSSL